MSNPINDDLKLAMERSKRSKELKKMIEDHETRSTDTLFVIPKDEVDLLEDVLLKLLTGAPVELSNTEKAKLLSIVNVIQS